MQPQRRIHGFTLIEMMVTLAVMAILVAMAAPSLRTMSERTALRGASDNVEGVISAAKEESIKRDVFVRVDVRKLGEGVCVGATTDLAGCNCATAPAACSVAVWPESERDLQKVTVVGDPLFGDDGSFRIDPRTGTLTDVADVGGVSLATTKFASRVRINALGRPTICTPTVSGKTGLSGVEGC